MAKKAKVPNPFTGRWRIVSMSAWDESFIDAEEEGYFEFSESRRGEFGTDQEKRASCDRQGRATLKGPFFVSFLCAFQKLSPSPSSSFVSRRSAASLPVNARLARTCSVSADALASGRGPCSSGGPAYYGLVCSVLSGASCGSWFGPKHWLDSCGAALVKLVLCRRVSRGRYVLPGHCSSF